VLALLKALLAAGPRPISLERLADRLWPGEESERSDSAIRVLLHRVRDLLGDAKALRVEDGRVWIDQDRVWVDAYAFERYQEAAAGGSEEAFSRALALYSAPFFSDEETMPWCVDRRDRLRARFDIMVNDRALGLRRDGRILEALALFEDVLQGEELVESFHRGRIACLIALGREGDAMAAYSRLRQILQVRLLTMPSAETELLIAPVRSRASGKG
jgi:DNA-binding SARP family transcriptional activator